MAIKWKEGELDDLRREIARYNRKIARLRACLSTLAYKAQRIIDNAHGDPYDPVDVHDFLLTVTAEARVRGLIK